MIPQRPSQLNVIRWERSRGRTGPASVHLPPPSPHLPPPSGKHRLSALSSRLPHISAWRSATILAWSRQGQQNSPALPQGSMVVSCRSSYLFQPVSWPVGWRHHHLADGDVGGTKCECMQSIWHRKDSTSVYLVLKVKLAEERLGQCKPVFKTVEKQTNPSCCQGNGCAQNGLLVWLSDPLAHRPTWNTVKS